MENLTTEWEKPQTLHQLARIIADDIDDTQGEYDKQIKQAVSEAIRHCERETFYFNAVDLEPIFEADQPHPWFVEACDLIRARAKYNLYKNILKDMAMADVAYRRFLEELQALRRQTSKRNAHPEGYVAPTGF